MLGDGARTQNRLNTDFLISIIVITNKTKMNDLISLNTGSEYRFLGNKISEGANLVGLKEDGFIFSYSVYKPEHERKFGFSDFNGKCREYEDRDDEYEYFKQLEIPDNVVEVFGKTAHSGLSPVNFEHEDYVNKQKFIDVLEKTSDKLMENSEWVIDNNLKLTRSTNYDDYQNTFIIGSGGKILNALCTRNYGDGDSGTRVFVLGGENILIANYGDCPSILLIQNNQLVDPIPKEIMICGQDIKSHYRSLQQSIINILYQFYDEDSYGVFSEYNGTFFVKHNSKTNKELILKIMDGNLVITNCSLNNKKSFKINEIDNHSEIELIRQFIQIKN